MGETVSGGHILEVLIFSVIKG